MHESEAEQLEQVAPHTKPLEDGRPSRQTEARIVSEEQDMQRPSEKRNRVTPIPTAGQRAGGVANARTTPQNYTTAHPRNAEYASTRGRFEARTVQNRAPADQRLYRSQIRRSTLSRKDDQSARIVGRGTRTVPTRTTGTAGPLPTTAPIFKG